MPKRGLNGRAGPPVAPSRSRSSAVSLRKIAAALAERGYLASTGKPYEAAAVASMLGA